LKKSGCKPNDEVFIDYEEVEDDFDIDEEKGLYFHEVFRTIINRFRNHAVTVEFECAGCCKKATGILQSAGGDHVLLVAPAGASVVIGTFCQGMKEPVIECANQAVIRFEKIISVEMLG